MNAAQAESERLRQREADIIEACERVADGGQYRADIVSAIQRLRRERDEARSEIERHEDRFARAAEDADGKRRDLEREVGAARAEIERQREQLGRLLQRCDIDAPHTPSRDGLTCTRCGWALPR